MENEDSSLMAAELDVVRLDQPTDRRPDFCAEALSPRARIGLLLVLLLAVVLLFVSLLVQPLAPPQGLHEGAGLLAMLTIGGALGLLFLVMLIFGALVANNPRVGGRARLIWYSAFLLSGPIALPLYWFKEVWPVPFEPSV